jgi:hypothetical protein
MLLTVLMATLVGRTIEPRSIYDARLMDGTAIAAWPRWVLYQRYPIMLPQLRWWPLILAAQERDLNHEA